MQLFFETPYLFWYVFVFSFLICTGMGSVVQCWFLIHFCGIKSKKRYYIAYALISYGVYIGAVLSTISVSPMLDTFIGVLILFVFSLIMLKQTYMQSAIVATLTMAVTTLCESVLFLVEQYTITDAGTSLVVKVIAGILFPVISFVVYRFFVARYSVNGRYQSNYLLAFSLPIFFIAVILRMINYIRYQVIAGGITLQSDNIQSYEIVILTVIAFLCICVVLFAYEKTMKQVESDHQKMLLQTQIAVQESYVTEAKQKYETTAAFRHDFKNHILALRGLLDLGQVQKAVTYMERFEQTYQAITFSINTGNHVVDTLLGEKLSYAEQQHIEVKCDVTIPKNVNIDDFDLCTVFANAIDNAMKACNGMQTDEKMIDIVAKPNKKFFVIDIFNYYQKGSVEKGSGIGLTAIQVIAEKYHGAVEISDRDNLFRISVLLPFEE